MSDSEATKKKTLSAPKIYTRTGDKGQSSLFTGERKPKDDVVFEALGNTDELNSLMGLAGEYCKDSQHDFGDIIKKIQSTLLDIGSFVATPLSSATEAQLKRLQTFPAALTSELEKLIDGYQEQLPPLRNFILPSGGKCAATLHLARSVCRRLERSLQPLANRSDLDTNVTIYVNRLSDFLFVLARYSAFKEDKPEVVYKKPVS